MNITTLPEQHFKVLPQDFPNEIIGKLLPDTIAITPCVTGICTTCDNNDHCIWQHNDKINCEHFE